MPLPTSIIGADGIHKVNVTPRGELIVAPISFSISYYVDVNLALTEFVVVPAITGKCFIITALMLNSDKTFGSATVAETLLLYEAHPSDITTSLNIITQVDMLKNDRLPVTGLNLQVGNTRSIIAVATDNNVDVTVAGYYING